MNMKRIISFCFAVALVFCTVAFADDTQDKEAKREVKGRLLSAGVFGETGRLGVQLAEVNADVARRLGLPEERGAHVVEVIADSPASRAGLQKDDVIVKWNGERV